MASIQGKSGQTANGGTSQPGNAGVVLDVRQGYDGTVITADGHARYMEVVARGNVYSISTQAAGVTLAAANASLVAATFQPIVGFLNPVGSGVICYLLGALAGPQSTGAAAANEGIYVIEVAGPNASTSISGTVPLNNKTLTASGSKVVGSLNQAFTGNTQTFVIAKALDGAQRFAAPTASINVNGIVRADLDGLIAVPPGCAVGIGVLAAGTTITSSACLSWEEVPIAA